MPHKIDRLKAERKTFRLDWIMRTAKSILTIRDRFSALVLLNVVYLIAVVPAAYAALFAVGLAYGTVIVFYCIGLPIIMACAAVIALIMNHPKGNRTLAWRFTALPLVYLFMSLCIPGIWWRLPEPIPVTYAVPSVVPFVGWKGRITGMEVPELAAFDATLQAYMTKHNISQGALAVTYKGRLIMVRGYSLGNDESHFTRPTSLFRIGSLSNMITATAVLKLVQDGRLSLDAKITDILSFVPPTGQSVDPRLGKVTVADLLYQRGGWDIAKLGYDPMFSDLRISKSLGVPLPISQANIITYMSGVPLNHDPGTTSAYSNYGYMLLGRIIEAVSQQPYETYVRQNVLEPMGITDMQLGHSLPDKQLLGEVTYHSDFTGPTVFAASGAAVPWPYGGWNLENMDSANGWVANVVDMARFEASFDQPGSNPVLTQESIKQMFAPPPGTTAGRYSAMGWEVLRIGNTMNTWNTGSLDGTLALLVRRSDGVDWVVIFNQRESLHDPKGESYWEIDDLLHKAADAVGTWPVHSLFQQFP